MQSTFKVNTKELNSALKEFKRLNKSFFERSTAKIRVMPGGIEISGGGIYKTVHGETEGLSEIYLSLKLMYSYSSVTTTSTVEFTVSEGKLKCGTSVFSHPTIMIESWYSKPDLNLSMNVSDYEILKETYSKGDEYMENYNLLDKVKTARKKMNQSIEEAYQTLKPFNVTKSEILKLVMSKFSS
jgi:hypothetical protein